MQSVTSPRKEYIDPCFHHPELLATTRTHLRLLYAMMKYRSEIEIDRGVDELVGIFGNPDNTVAWLDGLRSVELVSGTLGEPGAKSKVIIESPIGLLELTETIRANDLPEEYRVVYEGTGYISWSKKHFVALDNRRTRFIIEQEVEFHGALRLAGSLIGGTIRRQIRRSVESFKRFAENGPTQ